MTRDPALWAVSLFATNILLQRFSLPGISIPVTLPLSLLWLVMGLRLGVLVLHLPRLLLWLAGASLSALVVSSQLLLVDLTSVSVGSWALWMAVWLPVVVAFRRPSPEDFDRCLRLVVQFGLGLSALSVLFVGLQLIGVPYTDLLGELLPEQLLVQGFVISYPLEYGSEIYKSNAWVTLEPSFLSFALGICVVAALLTHARTRVVACLVIGMLSTTAGSGFAIVVVALVALVVTGRGQLLRPHLGAALVLIGASVLTPFTRGVFERVTEVRESDSSTSLRAVEPYRYLWPRWIADPAGALLGYGPGASSRLVEDSGRRGLLLPNIAKVVFDYGLLVGTVLFALMVVTYLRSLQPALAVAVATSMFLLQPASSPLVMCTIVVTSLWTNARTIPAPDPPTPSADRARDAPRAAPPPGA